MTTHRDDGGPRLDAALECAAVEQAAANAAAGRRTVALAHAVAATRAEPESMLGATSVCTASPSVQRRALVAHRALVAEVACALGVSEYAARGLLADAEALAEKAPSTVDALCAGRISYQHAAKLADGVADLPAAAAVEVEAAVLGRASTLPPARFGALVRATRERLHPVPAEVRREAAELTADVWLDEGKDGMAWLTAHLPAPAAHAAYDRLTRTAARTKAAGDARGVGQLRTATLAALLLDDATIGESGSPPDAAQCPPDPLSTVARSVRPTLHVTVPMLTLTGEAERPAVLDGTTPLDPETARHLAARAPTLRRVLTDPVDGAMLTVDRRRYVVPADLRAFLAERDVSCRFPGCRMPTRRCDIDHTTAWADDGTTDAANLAHLCRAHHTLKHESRWQVEQLDAGVLAWISPRGRTYLTGPGSTDVLDRLDEWAVQASALTAERVAVAKDNRPDGPDTDEDRSSPPADRAQHAERTGDPPF